MLTVHGVSGTSSTGLSNFLPGHISLHTLGREKKSKGYATNLKRKAKLNALEALNDEALHGRREEVGLSPPKGI